MKTFWAALLAFIVANAVLFVMGVMFFATIAVLMSESAPVVRKNTVLHLDLSNGITDSPSNSPFSYSGFGGIYINKANTILQAVTAIDRAATDSNIEGIYINLSGGSISLANIEELRKALEDFKSSGKFIISYSDSYSQLGYYLASVADGVYLNPQGEIMWNGLSSSVVFYKGLLEKLGVEPEILRHGSFKAAVEPFMYDRMSPENRLQLNTMLNSIWGAILHDVSMSRGIDSAVLSNYATELAVRSSSHAVEYGFADALMYEDQVMELMGRLSSGGETVEEAAAAVLGQVLEGNDAFDEYGYDGEEGDVAEDSVRHMWTEQPAYTGENPTETVAERDSAVSDSTYNYEDYYDYSGDVHLMPLSDYINSQQSSSRRMSGNKIALIYADGDIIDGTGVEGSVGSETLAAKISDARKDDDIKAIVLRVNSPGGSALASEVIWREMDLARHVKPVIVSMGSVAASGGYYISCPADAIVANRMTLTGSIGVFGVMVDISRGMSDKLGITVDVAKTNPSADAGSMFRKLSPNEREVFMFSIEDIYSTFVKHVAEGRNMSEQRVDEIGGGRVWSGVNALDIGLVDGFGGLTDALSLAAERAGVGGDYRVWQVTDAQDNLTALLRSLGAVSSSSRRDELGEMLVHYNALKNMLSRSRGVQARMPYTLDIE